jgi:hypothetical protein
MGRGVRRAKRERGAPYRVEDDGHTILLSNGKRYQVHPNDRPVVRTWSMNTPLKLTTNKNLFFTVTMRNVETGQTIAARRLFWTASTRAGRQQAPLVSLPQH